MSLLASLMVVVLNVAVIYSAGYGSDWDYKVNGLHGPSKWKNSYPLCGNKAQSPINILTKHVVYDKNLGGLTLGNYDQLGNGVSFKMSNTNYSIGFVGQSKNGSVPQTVTFKGVKYRFYQFHFHWGVENHKGSEHLVDWQRYAGEIHLIHVNTKYKDVGAAIAQPDGLLVWGHFLKVNAKDFINTKKYTHNYFVKTMLDEMHNVKKCCNSKNVLVNLFKILPKSHKKFYTYQGSLTTPPCYESVRWVVNTEPIMVSETQMKQFRELKDLATGGGPIADNYRPPEPVNGRTVYCNFDPYAAPAGSPGVTIIPSVLTLVAMVASLLFTM